MDPGLLFLLLSLQGLAVLLDPVHRQLRAYQFRQAYLQLLIDQVFQADQSYLEVLSHQEDLEDLVDPEFLVCRQVLLGKKSGMEVPGAIP